MAKKKNTHVQIEDTELKPTVIGEISTKKKSALPLIIIFILLVAVVYFLPDITEYIENYKEESNPNNQVSTPNNNQSDNIVGEEIPKTEYSENAKLEETNFSIENIKITSNILTFDVINLSEYELDFNGDDFYLEIYNEDTLLERISLNDIIIDANEVYSFEKVVTYTEIKFIRLMEINEIDYPNVTLTEDGNNIGLLTCSKSNESALYQFENNTLQEIEINVSYESSHSNYENMYIYYKNLSEEYDSLIGTTVIFDESENSFEYNITYDLNEFENSDNDLGFDLDENVNVVNFINETNGYSCE